MVSTPFLVGIDLGTTNCAVAYVDTRTVRDPARLRATRFAVPQLVAAREVAARPVLPSFLYFGTEHERAAGELALPWAPAAGEAVGVYARDHGALVTSRQVASAKSWLAHGAVDRLGPLLPFGHEPGEPGISPLDASARYLHHIRDTWNHAMAAGAPDLRLESQQVVLTVPASFDEEARELTALAASQAGLAHVVLIEEPIAALYSWLNTRRVPRARTHLEPGAIVLVCDVGGGTTDFSLIRARVDNEGFERVAIGEHLLLGGDNLDLTLAALVEERLGGPRLSLARREQLRRECSAAKERLLSTSDASVTITMLGAGRAVVGGAARAELSREDVLDRLLGGFLPLVGADERPARDRRQALRELGLPYEPDPAITRHLAAFLAQGGHALTRPDAVLFNGGFFAPAVARQRVVDALGAWFGSPPKVLATDQPDAAVALGAAFYAALKSVPGAPAHLLVRAGSPRTYYVELAGDSLPDGHIHALTVMPRGTDEGTRLEVADRRFRVATNRPIAFALWSSTTRQDLPGSTIEVGSETLHRHAPLAAALRYGKRSSHADVEVTLSVHFTEVGTLELWLEAQTGHRWRLHFQVRAAPTAGEEADEGEQDAVIVAGDAIEDAVSLVRRTFGDDAGTAMPPAALTGVLEERLGYGKQAWPIDVLRPLADALIAVAAGRSRSAAHESRWLNLVGFAMRPGFGAAADAWRVGELRKIYTAGLMFPKDVQCQAEWLVLWQRVSGGFSTGQQHELATRLTASLGLGSRKPPRLNPQIERESWRLLACLERIEVGSRVRIGDAIAERLRRDPRNGSLLWSIGRVGARIPFYGPLDRVVPADVAERWIETVIHASTGPEATAALAQLAALTRDPARDASEQARERVVERLHALEASDDLVRQVTEPQVADPWRQGMRYFGEELPTGLRLA